MEKYNDKWFSFIELWGTAKQNELLFVERARYGDYLHTQLLTNRPFFLNLLVFLF